MLLPLTNYLFIMTVKVFSALASSTRLAILQLLANTPLNVGEILELLNQRGIQISHRESVYRAVEKLRKAGLVDKLYDNERKSLLYKIKYKKLIYDFQNGNISFT